MSSGFSGDYFSNRSQRPFTGQLPEFVPDPTSQILNRLPVITGKRSLAEFQAQNQKLSFYLRNVKSRVNTPSILGYPVSRNTEIPPGFLNYSSLVQNQNEKLASDFPVSRQNTQISPDFFSNTNPISRQITQNTPNFLNNPNLVPNQNMLQEAEYPFSRQMTQSTPNFLNNPNLVPNQNMLQEAEYLISRQNTQTTPPHFFNNSNMVPNQNILPEAEFSISRQNTQNTPNFLSYPNLVPTKNQKMMMNKLQELVFPLQKNAQNTPSISAYPNSVPNHNQSTMMTKLQDLAFPLPKISENTQNTPKLVNSSDSVLDPSTKMMNKLQELEKHLLDDDDEEDGDDTDTCSVVTNAEWSDTWRHLIGLRHHQPSPLSLSPTSSCSSCCSSSSPPSTLSLKQTLLEAARGIHENRHDLAREILTRLSHGACVTGTPEQRLTKHFSHALMARVGPTRGSDVAREVHAPHSEALLEVLPCFKLGFMAANLAILDATSAEDPAISASKRLHVIDFEIGRGGHYVHLIQALAVKNKEIGLKITAVVNKDDEISLGRIGDGLRSLATKVGVSVTFATSSLKVTDLSLEKLGIKGDENIAVNLPFKLNKLPDESVTTENLRDELLRRVKGLSPIVVTVVEQEMNTNTAPFLARVNETCDYYSALFESLDSIITRDNLDRVKIEEGLGRKLANVVADEGINRVERCEVFGKWRARMGMAGFKPRPISRPIVESLMGGSDVAREVHAPHSEALLEVLPCFKLGFMAANLAILDATSAEDPAISASKRLHVIDFEIGRGGHYVHLIQALAVKNKEIGLKITAVVNKDDEISLGRIGDGLRSLATKVGVSVTFATSSLKVTDLSLEKLGIKGDENIAVNLPFKLNKLPDESVTTENLRDELLRRVKGLSPIVVTVVEQEMNTNTAPFLARVNETCDYYSALFESLDSIITRDNLDRVKIEEGLGRKLANVVADEGINRVERCEVFGKWRARMGMAGFKPRPISRPIVESLMGRVGLENPGFTVKEENGGVLFGWMGRTLTVASAWQ